MILLAAFIKRVSEWIYFEIISSFEKQLAMKSKMEQLTVCKNFRLVKKLGTGAFGQIYLAQNKSNETQRYAAKLEQVSSKFPQLYFQAKMYKYLTSSGPVLGFPKISAVTTEGQYNIMLMDVLGPSLEDLFLDNNKQLSLRTVLQVGQQVLNRVEYMHEKQILHRDIKPDNFLMGIGKNSHIVYVIDLGLAKKYIREGKHIPYKQGKELTGTARYASISTHMGIEQARRDDIESIGYILMYLMRGILPWQNMKAKDTKTKYKMIMEKKISTPPEVLCKGFPAEMATFISYARDLKFQEKPDYAYLKGLLAEARKKNNIEMDNVYDWTHKTQANEVMPIKKNSLNKPAKLEEGKIQDSKLKAHQKVSVPNRTGTISSQNKGHSMNLTKNAGNKNQQNAAKPNFIETLAGQRITGPKISVVKR